MGVLPGAYGTGPGYSPALYSNQQLDQNTIQVVQPPQYAKEDSTITHPIGAPPPYTSAPVNHLGTAPHQAQLVAAEKARKGSFLQRFDAMMRDASKPSKKTGA